MTFSLATVSDIDALNTLVNSAYRGESSKAGWATEADIIDGIRTKPDLLLAFINTPDQYMFKLEDQGQLVGCYQLECHTADAYLGMLTVSPTLQAKGLGKIMIDHAEAEAKKLGMTKMVMTVVTLRDTLIAYYERRGFIRTGLIKPFPMGNPDFGLPKIPLEFEVLEKTL